MNQRCSAKEIGYVAKEALICHAKTQTLGSPNLQAIAKTVASGRERAETECKVTFSGVPTWIRGGDPPLASFLKDDSSEHFQLLKIS